MICCIPVTFVGNGGTVAVWLPALNHRTSLFRPTSLRAWHLSGGYHQGCHSGHTGVGAGRESEPKRTAWLAGRREELHPRCNMHACLQTACGGPAVACAGICVGELLAPSLISCSYHAVTKCLMLLCIAFPTRLSCSIICGGACHLDQAVGLLKNTFASKMQLCACRYD